MKTIFFQTSIQWDTNLHSCNYLTWSRSICRTLHGPLCMVVICDGFSSLKDMKRYREGGEYEHKFIKVTFSGLLTCIHV